MDNKNLWENKQWLKNILAKSGTEMKIENGKGWSSCLEIMKKKN